MELGDYINQYLLEHNLSYRQFAKMTGISHTYIANIVNGKTGRGTKPVLTLLKLKQLADGMGIDFNDFLSEIDVDVDLRESKPSRSDIFETIESLPTAIRELVVLFTTLNNEGQAKVLTYIEDLNASGRYRATDLKGELTIENPED